MEIEMKITANKPVLNSALPFKGVALRRLIEEVTTPDAIAVSGYNRTYNRHNR